MADASDFMMQVWSIAASEAIDHGTISLWQRTTDN